MTVFVSGGVGRDLAEDLTVAVGRGDIQRD